MSSSSTGHATDPWAAQRVCRPVTALTCGDAIGGHVGRNRSGEVLARLRDPGVRFHYI